METYNDAAGRRPSTEEVCREAAEKLGEMHIRSFRDDPDPTCGGQYPLQDQRPPPYSGYPNSPASSILVPPPPPPSPGTALKMAGPVPSAPPTPAQQNQQSPYYGFAQQHTASPVYLQVQVDPALSQGGSLGPSPVYTPSFPPPPPPCTVPYETAGLLPEMPVPPQPMSHYPPPTQVPANTTPVLNSVNVNMESTTIIGDTKQRLYPNYLTFSLLLFFLCWLLNPFAYICIIPALICSCVSCSTNTYGTSKFTGKWAFCCDLTALLFGLLSFLLAILPMVVIFSLASAGGYTALKVLEDWMNEGDSEEPETESYDYSF